MAATEYLGAIDWDGRTIKLYGLDMGMKPENVREATAKGLITAAAEAKVQDQLKAIATSICEHQEATPLFRTKVSCTPGGMPGILQR